MEISNTVPAMTCTAAPRALSPSSDDKTAARILYNAAAQAARNRSTSSAATSKRSIADILANLQATASVSTEQQDEYERRRAKWEMSERVANCFDKANIPPRYRTARLDELSGLPAEHLEAYKGVVRRLRQAVARPGVYALVGPVGLGKSHLGCALANEFCAAGRSAWRVNADEILRLQRATWDQDPAAEARFIQRRRARQPAGG